MKLLSIQVGLPRTVGQANAIDPMDREWTTGFFKESVSSPLWLGKTNLAGDGQADRQYHGGPDKAVNLYPIEHYPYWIGELKRAELGNGAFGENFTTSGLLESTACIGDILAIGQALVQISQPRQPCWKLARRWRIKDLARRVQHSGRTGWYFRVLQEGEVAAGLPFTLVDRPYPEWTVATANDIMHRRTTDRDQAGKLANCPALSSSWRATLARRATAGIVIDPTSRLDGPNL